MSDADAWEPSPCDTVSSSESDSSAASDSEGEDEAFISSDDDEQATKRSWHPPSKKRKYASSSDSESDEDEREEALSTIEEEDEQDVDGGITVMVNCSDLRQYLRSSTPWRTAYGVRLYDTVIAPLLQMGRDSNEGSRRELYDYLFSESGVPTGRDITASRVKYETSTRCMACNCCRDLCYFLTGIDWSTGRFCQLRVIALATVAAAYHQARLDYAAKPRDARWLKAVGASLWEVESEAGKVFSARYKKAREE